MILVVGAGPVGLTAALELARRGVEVRIVERAQSPSGRSRAIGVNPRTLEILEPSGATPLLLEAGTKIRGANLYQSSRRLFAIDFSLAAHRYDFMLALPQSRTEGILTDRLQSHGVEVERGCALTRLDARDGRPLCRLETRGRAREVAPRMVIGADGARSLVRQSLKIGFPGRVYDDDWCLMDARLDWPYEEEDVHVFTAAAGLLFVIAMGPGRFRLASDRAEPDVLLPPGARLRERLWRSTFRIAHRQASAYAKGPVFLAGDAAHVHAPIGARGMNLGIEDAATLAGLIARGETARYHELRHPIGRRSIASVERQTSGLVAWNPLVRGLRAGLAPALLSVPVLHRAQARHMLGLSQPNTVGL